MSKVFKRLLVSNIARLSQWLVGSLVTLLAMNATPEQIATLEEVVVLVLLLVADWAATLMGSS